jgi:arginase
MSVKGAIRMQEKNSTKQKVRLINVPYDSGKYGQRMGNGPIRLIQSNLVENMQRRTDLEVVSIEVDGEFPAEISTTFTLLNKIKDEVAVTLKRKAFPLVLSGNCSASAAVISAYDKAGVGVIWFDAHADCETPDSTTSGFLDGMAMTMMLNRCWKVKMNTLIKHPPQGQHVVLIGSRDISLFEKQFIAENKIQLLPADQLRSNPEALLKVRQHLLNANIDTLHIHVDVDVIDPEVGIANGYSVPNGLLPIEVTDVIKLFGEKIPISSATISSYDPSYDHEGKILSAIGEIINSIIAGFSTA